MTDKLILFHTTSVKVATALVTLGFEKITITSMTRTDNATSIVFWFAGVNADGLTASAVYHGMTKGGLALARSEPENVINYLRCALNTRDELIADIKATLKMIVIEKDGQKIAISSNASEETKRQIAEMI